MPAYVQMVEGFSPDARECASMRAMREDASMGRTVSDFIPTRNPDKSPDACNLTLRYCPDMYDMDGFRHRLRTAMDRAGLNPTAVARDVGADPETFRKMLNGTIKHPRLDHAAAYAEALGVSLDWLVTGHEVSELADRLQALPSGKRAAVEAMIAALETS